MARSQRTSPLLLRQSVFVILQIRLRFFFRKEKSAIKQFKQDYAVNSPFCMCVCF